MNKKNETTLKSLIAFCLWENDNVTFPAIQKVVGDEIFHECFAIYKNNYKRFVHRYIAISTVYHSLINISNFYYSTRKLYKEDKIIIDQKKPGNFNMALNEPFVSSLIIQYCKLSESLWDYREAEKNKSYHDKVSQFLKSESLKLKYNDLHDLVQKINDSHIKELRDKVFAHPFSDNKNKMVSLVDVVDKTYISLRKLCDENHQTWYDGERHKLKFYCEKYLFGNGHSQKHIKIIYNFLKEFREEYFFGKEPYLYSDSEKYKSHLSMELHSIRQYFK